MSFMCECDVDNLGIQGGNILHPNHVNSKFHMNFVSIFPIGGNY
jgi:hypothetical protein